MEKQMQTSLRSFLQLLEPRLLLSGGYVDPTIGPAAKALIDSGGMDVVQDVARARGGAIVAVGHDGSHIVLAKLNAAGKLDPKFADHGKMITAIGVGETSLDVSPTDGRIAITTIAGNTLHVAMYDSDGDPIVTFANNGLYTRKRLNWSDDRPRVEFNGGGDVFVVAGVVKDPDQPAQESRTDVSVIRLDHDGAVVTTDVVSSRLGSLNTVRGLDGSVYIAIEQPHFTSGFDRVMTSNELRIFRRLPTGAADDLYGTSLCGAGARVTVRQIAGESSIDVVGMYASADGSLTIMTAERVGPAPHEQPAGYYVYRLKPDGTLAAEPVKLSGLSNPTGFELLDDDHAIVHDQSPAGHDRAVPITFNASRPDTLLLASSVEAAIPAPSALGAIGAGGVQDFVFQRLQNGVARGDIALTPRGTLMVDGTSDNDVISVAKREKDGRLVARVNDDAKSFVQSRVKRIAISSRSGNDLVTIGPQIRGVYIDGGEGNDTLRGGDGGDFIIGGAGKDHLFGNDGHDTLLGGLGNDYLVGGAGKDMLIGNGGVDTLSGGGGNDRIYGGGGTDHILGGAGVDSAPSDLIDHRSSIENNLEPP